MKAEKNKPKGELTMNLTYTMQGDYLLPNLEVPESPKVGKYGMLRRSFLRSHKQALYTGMMLEDTLNSHLEQVDKEANMLLEKLMTQMMQEQGLTEELKSRNQMLWVQQMNNLRQSAEEVVLKELIYS
jgi:hypothetical protein